MKPRTLSWQVAVAARKLLPSLLSREEVRSAQKIAEILAEHAAAAELKKQRARRRERRKRRTRKRAAERRIKLYTAAAGAALAASVATHGPQARSERRGEEAILARPASAQTIEICTVAVGELDAVIVFADGTRREVRIFPCPPNSAGQPTL